MCQLCERGKEILRYCDGGIVKKISNQLFMEVRQDEKQSSLVKVATLIIRGVFERARELILSVVW